MLVMEASYQAKMRHINFMAYLDLDTFLQVVRKLAKVASFQVNQMVRVEAYCLDTLQAIQSFKNDSY
jgi:hypothetical protein